MEYSFAVTPWTSPNTTDGNGISVAMRCFLSSSKSFYSLVLLLFVKTHRLSKVFFLWKILIIYLITKFRTVQQKHHILITSLYESSFFHLTLRVRDLGFGNCLFLRVRWIKNHMLILRHHKRYLWYLTWHLDFYSREEKNAWGMIQNETRPNVF